MFRDLAPHRRRVLQMLFAASCTVIVGAGIREMAGLLNPVLLAGFLALLLLPLLQRLRPLGEAAVAVVILLVVALGLALAGFVGVSVRQLALELPRYEEQLHSLGNAVVQALAERGINAAAYLESALSGPAVASTVLNVSSWLAGGVGDLVLTLFIFAFMLAGMAELERRASREARDHSPLAARFLDFAGTIRGYMGARAGLGLAEALLDYLLLLAVGVEYALLWAVFSFVMTFVPTIGVTLSLLPPALLALLGAGWRSAVVVVVGFYAISALLGNVISPRVIGRQVHLSPLLSFLSVLFWAWLLGPTGALFSIPLTILVRDLALGLDAAGQPVPLDSPGAEAPEPLAAVSPAGGRP